MSHHDELLDWMIDRGIDVSHGTGIMLEIIAMVIADVAYSGRDYDLLIEACDRASRDIRRMSDDTFDEWRFADARKRRAGIAGAG